MSSNYLGKNPSDKQKREQYFLLFDTECSIVFKILISPFPPPPKCKPSLL